MHYVLDACALLAFLRGEKGADKIETLLLDNNNRCMAHASICVRSISTL
jgi:PIN domain nuclease of toxin-antitoxin system